MTQGHTTHPRTITMLVVHCTAGHSRETVESIMAGFRRHGWRNPGYHYVIDAAGTAHRLLDERRIARDAGLSPQETYDTLKRLTYRRILHYVPRRDIPHITYLRPRVDGADVALRPEVYEQLRDLYAARVGAMLRYMEDDAHCRSQQLLAYFGETGAPACDRCDVCVERRRQGQPQAGAPADDRTTHDLLDAVRRLCADGRPHPLSDLDRCGLNEEAVRRTLARLAAEGLVLLADDGTVRPAGEE